MRGKREEKTNIEEKERGRPPQGSPSFQSIMTILNKWCLASKKYQGIILETSPELSNNFTSLPPCFKNYSNVP